MTAGWFVASLAALTVLAVWSAWRWFPDPRLQFIAAVPLCRSPDGAWEGLNLTWYGALSATAYALAVLVFLILCAAAGASALVCAGYMALLLTVCMPASRWVVRLVEGHAHGFSVGGAAFLGILLAPWLLTAMPGLPFWPVLSASAIAYAFGEGFGRLACVSFGCCYGRPVEQLSPRLRRWCEPMAAQVAGGTRKAAYAGGLEGVPLAPVPGLTVAVHGLAGCLAAASLIAEWPRLAFLLAAGITLAWRVISELLRADFRGGRFPLPGSAYQWMAGIGFLYVIGLAVLWPGSDAPRLDVTRGLLAAWSPWVILSIQGLWIFVLLYMGRSTVTDSRICFRVRTPEADRTAGREILPGGR